MLNIYRDKIPKNSILWSDPERVFQYLLNNGEQFDNKQCREVMAKIDGVTVKKGEYIETKLGPTHIQRLQTGCTTVLIALQSADTNKIVSAMECGSNAINLLAEIQSRDNINSKVYTRTCIAIPQKEFKCIFDGVKYTDGQELYFRMRGWKQ